MQLNVDDCSDEGDAEAVSNHSCNGEDSDDGSIHDIPLRCGSDNKNELHGSRNANIEGKVESVSYHTLTRILPVDYHFGDGYGSANRATRRGNARISTMGDLHVILQRERYRGATVNNPDMSKCGRKDMQIVMSTASARASILSVSRPLKSLLWSRESSLDDPSQKLTLPLDNQDKQNCPGASGLAQHKQQGDGMANGTGKGFRTLSDHSTGSEVKKDIHKSRDHQVEVFDRLLSSEDTGNRQKNKTTNDRFRSKAALKLRVSRQQAILSRLTSASGAHAHAPDMEIRSSRSNPDEEVAENADADDFLTSSLNEPLADPIDNYGQSNSSPSSTRTSRRASSVVQARRVASIQHRRSSVIGSAMLGSTRRHCEMMPSMDEIMKMVQEIPISKNKLKFVEIPRMRSRFHDREGKILNGMFEEALSTTRRTNERTAESLGLDPEEWDWQHTYSVSVSQLKSLADKKLVRRQVAAALLIEACWRKHLRRRERLAEEALRQREATRLQRWWRRRFAFVPVQRKARKRLKEKQAATKIQALVRRYLLRKRLQLEIEMHHLIYSLSEMQYNLYKIEDNKLLRWQGIARSLMLRYRLLHDTEERRAAVFAAFDGQLASEADADLDDVCQQHESVEPRAFDGPSILNRKQHLSHGLGSAIDECRPYKAKFGEITMDDNESLPSTRAPSSNASRAYSRSISMFSTRTPTRTPTRPGSSARDTDMLTPTPPPGKPLLQRPHSSCSNKAPFAGSPHKSKFHPILPRHHYVEWAPLAPGDRLEYVDRLARRALTPGR